jgi:hypothetical protein
VWGFGERASGANRGPVSSLFQTPNFKTTADEQKCAPHLKLEGNEMFLDAVLIERTVIYNSIPENVKKYLMSLPEEILPELDVYDGKLLKRYTVADYLAR